VLQYRNVDDLLKDAD
jgi:hypothetical protein